MRIAITGYSGFVGTNLIRYISLHKAEVVTINIRKDFTGQFDDTDAVIHLAGKAHDTKGEDDPKEYYRINYELTKKVFDEFVRSNSRTFLFLSSVKAVKENNVSDPLSEETECNPVTDYGKSKLLAEQYIMDYRLCENKRRIIIRPTMIHGPGNKGNLNLLYKLIKNGMPYPLASFDNSRSFLSIENLCFIIWEIVHSDKVLPGIYNASDNEVLSTNRVIEITAQTLSKKPLLWHLPKGLIKVAGSIGDIFNLPFNTNTLEKLIKDYKVNNKKILSAMGKSLPVPAEEGLRLTIRSFIDNHCNI